MNDKFTDKTEHDDDFISQKLNRASQQTQVNGQFAAELEERLRSAHRPRAERFATFAQVSPTLRWVALMVVLALVLSWSIKSLIPAPQPAVDNTPVNPDMQTPTPAPDVVPDENSTPVTREDGYNFRGGKLFIQQPLPESPGTAHVYLMSREDRPATQEQARALADRFGIQGEVYRSSGLVFGTDDFLITDGKQSLQVHSDQYFVYTADMENNHNVHPAPSDQDAERIIREFLIAHGFDFRFKVFASEFYVGYVVQPLAPDGLPMQYESYTAPMMRITLDKNGEVLVVDASLMNYDSNALGEYGIISAQEAFDKLLDDTILTGKVEFGHSPTNMPKEWYRTYADNQPATVYGYNTIYPSMEAGKPALIVMDGVPLFGNTSGMESLEHNSFIGITGQYIVENGVRKFNVESWNRKVNEVWVSGILSQQGDQVIVTSDDGSGQQYTIIDPPTDLPIGSQTPENSVGISGVLEGDSLSWYYIQFFESNSGGGGGGGGLGFHKLNLSGIPVPFPSPTPQFETSGPSQPTGIYIVQEGDTLAALAQRFGTSISTLNELNGLTDENIIFIGQNLRVPMPEPEEQSVQDLRGYLGIALHIKADGSSVKEYTLNVTQNSGGSTVYTMEGPALSDLADGYNGLPILVTGMINKQGKLVVDSFRMPYDNLQFQILKGTQRVAQLGGQTVIIFTTEEGQTYVEYLATNPFPADSSFLIGIEGDLIEEEVLIIPDETFADMPVAHVYQSAIVQENGSAMEVQSNRIYVYNESNEPTTPPEFTQPDLTINKIELVYFVSNPYYQVNDPNYELRSKYIQPVWHFQGVYANGNAFDVLIQALKQEFLLPELVPGSLPG